VKSLRSASSGYFLTISFVNNTNTVDTLRHSLCFVRHWIPVTRLQRLDELITGVLLLRMEAAAVLNRADGSWPPKKTVRIRRFTVFMYEIILPLGIKRDTSSWRYELLLLLSARSILYIPVN
jgi:hypothetical protein